MTLARRPRAEPAAKALASAIRIDALQAKYEELLRLRKILERREASVQVEPRKYK
jgi:hypothetical protein